MDSCTALKTETNGKELDDRAASLRHEETDASVQLAEEPLQSQLKENLSGAKLSPQSLKDHNQPTSVSKTTTTIDPPQPKEHSSSTKLALGRPKFPDTEPSSEPSLPELPRKPELTPKRDDQKSQPSKHDSSAEANVEKLQPSELVQSPKPDGASQTFADTIVSQSESQPSNLSKIASHTQFEPRTPSLETELSSKRNAQNHEVQPEAQHSPQVKPRSPLTDLQFQKPERHGSLPLAKVSTLKTARRSSEPVSASGNAELGGSSPASSSTNEKSSKRLSSLLQAVKQSLSFLAGLSSKTIQIFEADRLFERPYV